MDLKKIEKGVKLILEGVGEDAGREVVIVGAARTPIGSFMGSLAAVPAPRLGHRPKPSLPKPGSIRGSIG